MDRLATMKPVIKPSAVIFDFDGVVVDSLAVHLTAWKISFQKLYGYDLQETAGLAGRSTKAIAEILSTRAAKPETSQQLADMKRDVLRENQITIQLLPGAKEAFSLLHVESIPFGIASNAPKSFISGTLGRLGIKVETFFGIDDVENPKPAPDVFLKCAKALGVSVLSHSNIMVFEDSPHGVRAAVVAGMFPIGVLTQNNSEQMFSAGARACCNNIEDAIEKGWFKSLPS